MLFKMKIVTTIHIVPLVKIVGANATLIEPTYKHPVMNLGQAFQKTLFIK